MCKVNFELGTCDAKFGFDEERVARLSTLEMEHFSVESCVGGCHVYKAQIPLVLAYLNERYWPRFLVVLVPCSLLCSLPPSPHAGQLENRDHADQGHCEQGTSSEKEL